MVSNGTMILPKTTTICTNNGRNYSIPYYPSIITTNNNNQSLIISCSSCRKYYHLKNKLLFQLKKSHKVDAEYYDNNHGKNGTSSFFDNFRKNSSMNSSSSSPITSQKTTVENVANKIIDNYSKKNNNKLLVEMEKMIYDDDGNMEKMNTLYEELSSYIISSPSSSGESRENVNVIKQAIMKVILKGIRKLKKYSIAMDAAMTGQFFVLGCWMDDIEFVKEMIEFGRKNKLKVFFYFLLELHYSFEIMIIRFY